VWTDPSRDATGWQEAAFVLVERAVDHFTRIGDHANVADALLVKAWGLAPRDHFAAIATLKEAQRQAIESGSERMQVEIWDELGGTMLFGPTPYPETLDFVRKEIAWAREHGIAFTVADGRLGEAYSLAALARFDEARALLDELIDFFAQLPGQVSQHGECYTLAGRVERDRDNPAESALLYRRAMELFERAGRRRWWRNAAPGLAHALLDMDRVDEAKSVLDQIKAHSQSTEGRPGAFRLEAEARYMVRTGDPNGGLATARDAVAAVANTGAIQYEGRARETLAGLLAATGDSGQARTEYALARALYERKGYLPGISRIDALTGQA
jgi:tetratricopeptide (TPR) repeat protein